MPGCICKNELEEKNEIDKNQTEDKNERRTTNSFFQFHPITLDKKPLIESYTKPWGAECSDLSFANMFIWGTDGKMEYAEKDHVLYLKLNFKGVPVYFWAPIPKAGAEVNYRNAVYDAIDYMKKLGVEPTFRSVSTPFFEMMQKACPELIVQPTDIAWDYVYEREKLETLAGKKLHGKRNHVNKFLSQYPDFEYKKLEASMIQDCIALYDQWQEEKDEISAGLKEERKSVLLALNHMKELGLVGGVIFIEGKLAAFTLGERLQPHLQLVHIEKAEASYEGIYPMINQQYVKNECMDVELINREEDMGIEGMRKAKRAYYPVKMIEKYMFSIRDLSQEKGIWGQED
ncbi:MAG: phosphatidylglycerol lysyltransferase domain-containing protein [Anaerotignum sp.]|nr:phosphatidylglycerol lysyltransferase domain-containing protein [Anaerotignum sp.]